MTDTSESQPYRVLARKYRPSNFAGLIGQDAMVQTLTNAIAIDRLPHAFILTGVRGIGKTSTARIIARALNCIGEDGQGGPTADPCGVCDHCTAIAEDRHVDVIEMDAASRTGVNDIRELIDGVRYRPVEARFKIYIIDEVHMLSNNAFNALLKTLEEPPEHVKFIFATTETRKVPVTVLSRCQRFDLRRVDTTLLVSHFSSIAEKEGVAVSDGAMGLIARAADGSVRDGLSLLDQAISHAGAANDGGVTDEMVRDMLGLADGGRIYDLYQALMGGDTATALTEFAGLYDAGADPAVVIEDMLNVTHWLTRVKLSPEAAEAPGTSELDRVRGTELADRLSLPNLGRVWQLLLKGLSEIRNAPSAYQAAEMVLIRLAYMAELPSPADVIKSLESGNGATASSPAASAAPASGSNGGSVNAGGQTAPAATPSEPATPVASISSSPMAAEAVGQSGPEPVLAPEPELAEPPSAPAEAPPGDEPAGLRSFADVVNLFDDKREARLAVALRSKVHLVSFEPGHIAYRAAADAPPDLATRVSHFLTEWTGQQWLISVSSEAGEATLREQKQAADEARRSAAISHPLVQAALETFPGARVEAVNERDPETVAQEAALEAPPEEEDDDQEL